MSKILVVDDHAWNRALVVTVLKHAGHVVTEAQDGLEALKQLEEDQADLVICDLLMPTMDGYEFVRQIRLYSRYENLPVIFYTATFFEHEARTFAESLGVTRILTKPCEPEEILEMVTGALEGIERKPTIHEVAFDRTHTRLLTEKLIEKVDALEAVNHRLDALTAIGLRLASEDDPERLLEHVCRGARDLFVARYAVLVVRDRFDADAFSRFTAGMTDSEAERVDYRDFEQGVFGAVMRDRMARRVHRASHTGESIFITIPDWEHGLVAPLCSLNHVYGWLLLLDRLSAAPFTLDDERLLSIHTAQAGRIYENGSLNFRLKRQVDQLESEVLRRAAAERSVTQLNRVYSLLSRINALIVRAKTRDDLFREICTIAVDQGHFVKAWIGILAESGPEIAATAGCDATYEAVLRSEAFRSLTLREQFSSHVIDEHRIFVINDLETDLKPFEVVAGVELELAHDARRSGSRAVAWLPIVVNGKTVAILSLHAKEAAFFNEAEMLPLAELAGDISYALEHINKAEQLDYLSYFDTLTGLANASLFSDRLAQQLNAAAKAQQRLAIALVDINRFTAINEAFGRPAGDELLKAIATRLADFTASPLNVARLSGDNFVVALGTFSDESALAREIEDSVLKVFARSFSIQDQDVRCSARIGIALFPSDGENVSLLMRNAETALIRAKDSSEPYLFYDQRMSARVAERLALETDLRDALDRSEFILYYQPKLDIATHAIEGLEALIRWKSPKRGLVSPAAFIPILEETNLIIEVGAWVAEQAISDRRQWKALGIHVPRIAVNVSAVQLRRADFVSRMAHSLADEAPSMDLEITESLLMEDVAANATKLEQLAGLGVHVAIDDFGTGYSSLSYLSRLPVNVLKVDGSFVVNLDTDANQRIIVAAVISLAHSLRMKVVAEGVETKNQELVLLELGCDQVQGYLHSRPLSFDAMTTYLRQHHDRMLAHATDR